MTQMNLFMKQKQIQGDRELTGGCQGGRDWGRDGVGDWASRGELLYIE